MEDNRVDVSSLDLICFGSPLEEPERKMFFSDWKKQTNLNVLRFCTRRHGEIVAYALVKHHLLLHVADIVRVGVRPDWRRKKIATTLIDDVCAFFPAWCRKVSLVDSSDAPAVRLFSMHPRNFNVRLVPKISNNSDGFLFWTEQ